MLERIPHMFLMLGKQGVKKRCRLSLLTNSALVYESKCGGGGGCGVSANEYSCAHGAQINFGDIPPYLTFAGKVLQNESKNISVFSVFYRYSNSV